MTARELARCREMKSLVVWCGLFCNTIFMMFDNTILMAANVVRPSSEYRRCRCLPDDHHCWPSQATWNELNSSVGGHLLVPYPPASPCHDGPHRDAAACQSAAANWTDPFWRSGQPGAMQNLNWESDGGRGCQLSADPGTPCYQGAVAAYAVDVREAAHVQAAVRFTARHNLKLTVKSTGHDLSGKSTSAGSLNVWMHHMKDIAFHDSFVPDGCAAGDGAVTPTAAVTAGAGVQWDELYTAADARNQVVVGGFCRTVSTGGGYLQGGGHSALSPLLGLAADNVLQLTVVTADGELRTANPCQNQELFWALRGGGGGTFGVVVSATHRAHPGLSSVVSVMYRADVKTAGVFEGLLARNLAVQVAMREAGAWTAYSFMNASWMLITVAVLPEYSGGGVSTDAARRLLGPLREYARGQSAGLVTEIESVRVVRSYGEWRRLARCSGSPDFCNPGPTGEATGGDAALASRLVPDATLRRRPADVVGVLMCALSDPRIGAALSLMVGGGAVAEQGRDVNAVNPAWRDALCHVLLTAAVGGNATMREKMQVLTEMNGLLRELTPGSGAYLNEADSNEPDWRWSFFGDHYPRLLRIKQTVDPDGLFACSKCVGSEGWNADLNCRAS